MFTKKKLHKGAPLCNLFIQRIPPCLFRGFLGGDLRVYLRDYLGGDFCGEVALGDFYGLAALGGIDDPGHLGKDTEHQELAYSGEDGAVDDAHRWKQGLLD